MENFMAKMKVKGGRTSYPHDRQRKDGFWENLPAPSLLFPLSLRPRFGQKARVHDLPPTPPERARPRWWLRGLLLLAVASTAWLGWRESDRRAAIREAQAAGCFWGSEDAIDRIRADWRAAFALKTWTQPERTLTVNCFGGPVPDAPLSSANNLASLRPLLLRLRPTKLYAYDITDTNLEALRGLADLRVLYLLPRAPLQSLHGIEDLFGLEELVLPNCTALQNVDALRSLPNLKSLDLEGCPAIRDTGALGHLTRLEWLSLARCPNLRNVDALKALPHLKRATIQNCPQLPPTAEKALQAARPGINTEYPEDY
jgi:hypothetical protein